MPRPSFRSAIICLMFFFSLVGVGSKAQSAAPDRLVQPISGAKLQTLSGTVHPLATAKNDAGPVSASMALHGMTIDFSRSAAQQSSLTALIKAQETPGSASYRKWLTIDQFAAQYGMSQSDLSKVTAWLQSQGFTIDKVAESANSIRFSGTVAQAEQAFHTQIHNYKVGNETHFANATAISIPQSLAGVVSRVGGLHDFTPKPKYVRPHSGSPSQTGSTAHFTSGVSGDHYVAPGDFAVIYNLNPLYSAGFTGKGLTIGISGESDIVTADISDFRSAAGLPANAPTVFLIPGSADPGVQDASGDIVEADLDIEWSGAVATAASIVYINSTNALDSLQYGIENKINNVQIPILTNSYGECEQGYTTADINSLEASFEEANAQGQTVMSAAGDSGATDCDDSSTTVITSATQGLAVDYPASSAYVTGMGGSEFMGDGTAADPSTGSDTYWTSSGLTDVLTSAISYIPEMAWNDSAFEIESGGGLSAGGGGASILFAKPSWQTGVPGIPTNNARNVPDLSLNASPDHDGYLICTQTVLASDTSGTDYVSSCDNGFRTSDPGYDDDQGLQVVGGTSVDGPTFAGILAVIEQKLGTTSGLGNINPTLYTLASNSTTYASAFHDITTGNNDSPCTVGTPDCPSSGEEGFSAGTGYDQATGLGSVNAENLASAFASVQTKAGSTTSITLTPTTPVVGTSTTITATVTPNTGTTTPTGTITFTINGTVLSPITLVDGTASTTFTFAAGGANTITAAYSGDTNFFASSGTDDISVGTSANAPVTTTTLTASPTSVAINGSLTLTANITSATAGTIAGTVTFSIGSTTIGTATVTPGSSGTGTATYSVSSASSSLGFTTGTDTITATYGGDTNYGSSSGTATVTVTNPGLTMTIPNMTIASTSAGSTGTSTITVTSTGGYAGTVNFTATASTLNADAEITPPSLTIASGASGTATISIQSIAGESQRNLNANMHRLTAAAGAGFGALFLLGIPAFRRKRWSSLLCVLLLLGGVGSMMGCSSSSSSSVGGTTAGTYTVTVTATDSVNSAITVSTNFTVTVQ